MKLNSEKYLSLAEGLDLTREQKLEFIHCIWGIMESCVDSAFGIHPVQNVCGIHTENTSDIAISKIDSKGSNIEKPFNYAGNIDV